MRITASSLTYIRFYIVLSFGKYEEVETHWRKDKVKTTQEALLSIYENQRSDEIPDIRWIDQFNECEIFDPRRYDSTKAGRFKLRKKLNAINRLENNYLAQDIVDVNGNVVYPSGTLIHRDAKCCAENWQRALI